MASPLQAFNSLPPPAKFGIIGVAAAGAYVFIKKWRAAKAGNSSSPNMMTVGTAPVNSGIPGWNNGGGGGGIGDALDLSGLEREIAQIQTQLGQGATSAQLQALQQQLQALQSSQPKAVSTASAPVAPSISPSIASTPTTIDGVNIPANWQAANGYSPAPPAYNASPIVAQGQIIGESLALDPNKYTQSVINATPSVGPGSGFAYHYRGW